MGRGRKEPTGHGIRSNGALWLGAMLATAGLFSGCAGQARTTGTGSDRAGQTGPAPERTIVIAFRNESTDLAAKIPNAVSSGQKELFNAYLIGRDHQNAPQPFLAEALPQLNTDTWRVYPDGKMDTTYRLKPGLTWHDGQPLTADDLVFAWMAYSDKGLGVFSPKPQDLIEDVIALDSRTVVIHWRALYGEADVLTDGFPPLPRHILGQAFADYQQDPTAREALLKRPFWTTEWVGLGPYRLDRWEPGYALYADAFPGYVFGRPKIDHVIARIFGDENTVLTNMLSDEVQLATVTTLRFENGMVLRREWGSRGTVFYDPTVNPQHAVVQFRPEYQKTPGLLDVRVRKALNHAIDRQALQDGLFDGEGVVSHSPVSPLEPFYPELDRTITKYEYDPRKTEVFMNEAGFFKDSQGYFVDGLGQRFRPDFQVLAGPIFERHQTIMQNTWSRAGIETVGATLSLAQQRDLINRSTFPGLGQRGAANYTVEQIGTPENRWTGANLGGYTNPDYEALWAAFNTTLERAERDRLQVQMAKLASEQLPGFMLYFNTNGISYVAALHGPQFTNIFWSVHAWEFRQ